MAARESEKKKKAPVQLPISVISYYKKYRNTSPTLKTQIIMGSRFDIDDRYEIIDISKKKNLFSY